MPPACGLSFTASKFCGNILGSHCSIIHLLDYEIKKNVVVDILISTSFYEKLIIYPYLCLFDKLRSSML